MGAPRGNKNSAKGRSWEDALRRALSRAGGTVVEGLNPIADKVVALATTGDLDAIREIACRLDGKPTEHVHIEQDLTVNVGEAQGLAPRLDKLRSLRSGNTIQ